ncbi:hypothetical protein DESUT3_15090 [Desulfuromonas versatilis]|uniref:VanZ-like domain-containing protein n=1 Tax=Desulfuromonas versatilis TaxID=2802975 RepID=A0ABN6DWJ2_9BACT|nr:hypothetical protein [Desulfuromonas versatilis]BCR04440.1 hypothetical protein DESUT3_15090 [Desulfuromonas versatilis]
MSSRFNRILIPALVLYGAALTWLWLPNPGIAEENRLMENLQALSLLAGLVCACATLMDKNRVSPSWLPWMLTLFFFTLFLREVDFERLDLPPLIAALGSGSGRNLLLSAGWAAGFGVFLRRRMSLWPALRSRLLSRAFLLLATGAVFYVLAVPFDQRLLFPDRTLNRFLEELCENYATFLLFWGALVLRFPALEKSSHRSCAIPPRPGT